MESYVIRPMSPEIILTKEDEILAIAKDQPDEYWTKHHFLKDLPGKWDLSFVVFRLSELVAYAVLSLKSPDVLHIHHLMVKQSCRRLGLGHLIVKEIEARASMVGVSSVTLKVRYDNHLGKLFYSKQGFELEEGLVDYQLMKKNIFHESIAIHQPNYMPWLGYFYKIKKADHFVFLDDVQHSKGSYINRVRIPSPKGPKWLTVPVTFNFGDLISQVMISKASWTSSHLDLLKNTYHNAPFFRQVWPEIKEMYQQAADKKMHESNMFFIKSISAKLGLTCNFHVSSSFGIDEKSDERLVSIVKAISPAGTYLSGKGGGNYQDETKFTEAGLQLRYLNFNQPHYNQGKNEFEAGLSVLDVLFHLGWDGCAELLSRDNSQ